MALICTGILWPGKASAFEAKVRTIVEMAAEATLQRSRVFITIQSCALRAFLRFGQVGSAAILEQLTTSGYKVFAEPAVTSQLTRYPKLILQTSTFLAYSSMEIR